MIRMHIQKWLPSLTGEFVEFPTHLDLFISIDIRGIKGAPFNYVPLRKYFYDKGERGQKGKSIASAKRREAERENGKENLDRNWDSGGSVTHFKLLHFPLQTHTYKGAIAEEV